MAVGRVRHWKHGWIPVSPEAKAFVAGTGPAPGHWAGPGPRGTAWANTRVFVPAPGYKPLRVRPKDAAAMMDEVQRNGGFTYDPKTGGLLKVGEAAGFAVAIPGTEQVVGVENPDPNVPDITREDFAKGVAKVLMDNRQALADGAVLGGWYSPERNQYMVELTEIHPPSDRAGAIKLGEQRNQEAIFDLSNGEMIFTGGTGDATPDFDIRELDKEPVLALTAPGTPLTREERAAALYYTGPGYIPLNSALRTGTPMPPQVASYRRNLDAALATHQVQQDTTVYRGMRAGPWLDPLPPGFNPGDTYFDPAYQSTAVGDGPPKGYPADVMFKIEVHKGAHAIDLNGNGLTHHQEEREMLLPSGTSMNILSDTMINGQRVVHAEVTA